MHAGDLRAALEAVGTPIGPHNLLIAAQALRSGQRLSLRMSRSSRVLAVSSGRTGPQKTGGGVT